MYFKIFKTDQLGKDPLSAADDLFRGSLRNPDCAGSARLDTAVGSSRYAAVVRSAPFNVLTI